PDARRAQGGALATGSAALGKAAGSDRARRAGGARIRDRAGRPQSSAYDSRVSEGNAGGAPSGKDGSSTARNLSPAWRSRVPTVRSETPNAAAISLLL